MIHAGVFNPHLSTAQIWTDLVLLSLAALAMVVQARASRYGMLEFARVHAGKTILAAIYTAGYAVLLFTDVAPGDWSRWMLPVGLVAWPVAWTWGGLVSVRIHRKAQAQVREVIEECEQ